MNTTATPNLNGINFNSYQQWRPVKTPSGGVYYAVPGTPYVYDPFLSAARGKPVLWQNPEPAMQERADAESERDRQIKAQERASSPTGQLLPVAGTVIGTAGTAYALNKFGSSSTPSNTPDLQSPTKTGVQRVDMGGSLSNPGSVKTPEVVNTPPPATGDTANAFVNGAQGSGGAPIQGPAEAPVAPKLPDNVNNVGADGSVTMKDGVTANPETGKVIDAGGNEITGAQALSYLNVALQAVNAYRTFTDKDASTADKAAAGVGLAGAAGAASLAATGGSTILGSSTLAQAVPGLNVLAGLYTGYKTAEMQADAPSGGKRNNQSAMGGAAAGASIGSVAGPYGAAIGAAVGAAAGFLGSYFGSSKGERQMIRDGGRKYLQETGIIGQDYKGTLADGSTFDFGKDGKGLRALDFKNPIDGKAAALGDMIAAGEGFQGKARESMAHLYAAAMTSNAKDDGALLSNFNHFARQRNFNTPALLNEWKKQLDEKKITQEQYDAFSNTANTYLGPGTPAAAPGARAQPLAPGTTPDQAAAAVSGNPPPVPPPRSTTSSPGISKNGQRVNYDAQRMGKAVAARLNARR